MKNFTLLSVLFVITTLSFGQISGTIRFSSDDYELRDTLISNNEYYAYLQIHMSLSKLQDYHVCLSGMISLSFHME